MIVGSILENKDFEQRVSITPDVVKKFKSLEIDVVLTKKVILLLMWQKCSKVKLSIYLNEKVKGMLLL